MRRNFGWQRVLTRCFAISTVMACATSMAWGQLGNPNPARPNPSSVGDASHKSNPTSVDGQQPQTTESSVASPQEATGNGAVLGAHFEPRARGTRQELKITKVDPNSPASHAGLQPKDRLISADGRSFADPRQLIAYLTVLGGRPVPIVLDRNGREMTVQLFPGQFQGDRAWLGVLLDENNNEQNPTFQEQPGQKPDGPRSANAPSANKARTGEQKGAEISQVYPNGPAARAGLRTGDVILQVNGAKIDDAGELVALVHEMKPKSQAELEVMRDKKQIKVPVTLGSRNQEYMAQFGPNPGPNQFGPVQGGPPQFGPGQWQGNGQAPGQFGPGQYGPGAYPGQFPQGPGQWQGQGYAGGSNSNEFQQQLSRQNQRIEEELKQLRDEIKQLREQLQKK
jgi:membrane-associated protease RseP (regulator of RpoE activity)